MFSRFLFSHLPLTRMKVLFVVGLAVVLASVILGAPVAKPAVPSTEDETTKKTDDATTKEVLVDSL